MMILKKKMIVSIVITLFFTTTFTPVQVSQLIFPNATEENFHTSLIQITNGEDQFVPPHSASESLNQYHILETMIIPDEIIVTFSTRVGRDAASFFIENKSFSELTGNSSLDNLNRRYHVKTMSRVFTSLEQYTHALDKEILSCTEFVEVIRQRYPLRATRSTIHHHNLPDLENIYRIQFTPGKNIFHAINDYQQDPDVISAELNYRFAFNHIPNDPYYTSSGAWGQHYLDLYGLHRIQTSTAWDISTGSHDVVVAVIDSGVDYTHPDLAGNMWINEDEIPGNGFDDDGDGFVDNMYGADFFSMDGDPMDGHGHGTHCAGTIAAVGNNSLGVVGVNWRTKIMAVKISNDQGVLADAATLADTILWSAAQGADVISMSWGGSSGPSVLNNAIQTAYHLGVFLVAAAGNQNNQLYHYPAAFTNVISVAATDWNDQKAVFSTYGTWIDVSAPGVDILSLRAAGTDFYGDGTHVVGDQYYRASGTSMACPHVAGLAALLLSLNSSFSTHFLSERIKRTADCVDEINSDYESLLGTGRINASRAVHIYQHNVGVKTITVSDSFVPPLQPVNINATIWTPNAFFGCLRGSTTHTLISRYRNTDAAKPPYWQPA